MQESQIIFYYEHEAEELSQRVAAALQELGYGEQSPSSWSRAKETGDNWLPAITGGVNAIFYASEAGEDALRIRNALRALDPPCYVTLVAGAPKYSPYGETSQRPSQMDILMVGDVFPLGFRSGFALSPQVERIVSEARSLEGRASQPLLTTAGLLITMLVLGDGTEDDETLRFLYDAVVQTRELSVESLRNDFMEWRTGTGSRREWSRVTLDALHRAELMSTEAARSLIRARQASKQTGDDGQVYARHLLTALLAERRDSPPSDALEWLSQYDLDSATLRNDFFAHLDRSGWGNEAWKGILLENTWAEISLDDDWAETLFHEDAQGSSTLTDAIELFTRNGTTVSIARDVQPWKLPVTGFVLPVGPKGRTSGGLALAIKEELSDDAWKSFDLAVKSVTRSGITFSTPAAFGLDPAQTRVIMKQPDIADDQEIQIIVATVAGADSVYDLRKAAVTIVERASESHIRRLAMPWLGTGSGPFQEQRALVAEEMVHGIWMALGSGRLANPPQEIMITTRSETALRAAQAQGRLLTSNLPQRFINDSPRGDDLLDIKPEVDALAQTLLQYSVEPPLAVGILGGWGSGKTFVMHLIRQEMNRIRSLPIHKAWDDEESDAPLSPYVGHIYQIEFNAWTYAKSDLWASLMQTIFFGLNRQLTLEQRLKALSEDEGIPPVTRAQFDLRAGGDLWSELCACDEQERQVLLENRGLAKDIVKTWDKQRDSLWEAFERLRERETTQLREVETELDRVQARIDEKRQRTMDEACKQARIVTWTALFADEIIGLVKPALIDQLREQFSDQALADLEAFGRTLKTLPPNLRSGWQLAREHPWHLVLTGCLALVMLGAAAVSTQVDDLVATAISSFTTLASFATALASLASLIQRSYKRWRETLDQVQARLATQLPANVARAEAQAERKLGETPAYRELVRQRDDYEVQAKELRERAGITQKFVSLQDFVEARLQSQLYEERLGLMHRADMDFHELTRALTIRDNDLHKQEKRSFFPRGPARVVLYIDDLDRCPPNKVVEVLEAVQLLLRTELFVVILGLDTRYITRALETEYEGILIHQGEPSGLDYIEKIIQIPYRIRPVQPEVLAKFLGKQMDYPPAKPEVREEQKPTGQPEGRPPTPEPSSHDEPPARPRLGQTDGTLPRDDGQEDEPSPPEAIPDSGPPSGGGDTPVRQTEVKPEPSPAVIQFKERDFAAMSYSCERVELTPRSIKRLTNVFKLMKAYWYRNDVLVNQDSRQAIINLLVLAARYPEIMREAFEAIETRYRAELNQPPQEPSRLDTFWDEFISDNQLLKEHWDRDEFIASVEALDFKPITFADLGRHNFGLVRSFSFVGDLTYSSDRQRSSG